MNFSHYETDQLTAFEAISAAQRIAFAPFLFQAAACLRDFGILNFLDNRNEGATLPEIATETKISEYGAGVLLDAGLSGKILFEKNEKFFLGKIGHFLLHDKMTRVNMDFMRDVCYAGAANLHEAIATGTPAGLRVFGQWKTIYEGLSSLPEPAKTSWFNFDHFYSDGAFDLVLPHVFKLKPALIYDLGGNTGKWALRCVQHNPDVRVTVLDLPQQVGLLEKNISGKKGAGRIDAIGVNLLGETALPGDADVWWMSQFLDCFSEEEIVRILKQIRRNMKPGAKVCILETYCDRQRFEPAAFSLNAGSLYFTSMANGNSRFYRAKTMFACLARAGFRVTDEFDDIGIGAHTLLVCE